MHECCPQHLHKGTKNEIRHQEDSNIILIGESYYDIGLQSYRVLNVSCAHVVALSEKIKYHSVWL